MRHELSKLTISGDMSIDDCRAFLDRIESKGGTVIHFDREHYSSNSSSSRLTGIKFTTQEEDMLEEIKWAEDRVKKLRAQLGE